MGKCKFLKKFFINHSLISDEVLADGVIGVDFPQIGRTRLSELYTHMAHKNYRPCYEKGRILPGMETLPFGYREEVTKGEIPKNNFIL